MNIESGEHGPARAAFFVGLALLEGRATAAPDDPFEAACGALISAVGEDDDEWSPRAAYVLGMALFDHDDLAGARTYFAIAQQSGHHEWSVGGLIGQALLAARERRPDDAAKLFQQVIETGQVRFLASAWYNLGTIYQQQRSFTKAAQAYEFAMAVGDTIFGPKAATNLGFVLANYLGDAPGARRAFREAIASGDPQQAQLAEQNLRAMDELDLLRREGVPLPSGEDGVDVSVPGGKGQVKRRWWFPWLHG
jgi:tetratricopeptide (TPR) repeat protein